MTLIELRCPACNAPVDASQAAVLTCRYCGATLAHDVSAPQVGRKEIFVVVLSRVGPSNRVRVAQLVHEHTHLLLSDATALVENAPSVIPVGSDESEARDLKDQIVAGGASAEVESRFIAVVDGPNPNTPLPNREVRLEDSGAHHVAVIKTVREYLDLGMAEAKHVVDSAPCVLTRAMEGRRANSFFDALVAAGAKATLL